MAACGARAGAGPRPLRQETALLCSTRGVVGIRLRVAGAAAIAAFARQHRSGSDSGILAPPVCACAANDLSQRQEADARHVPDHRLLARPREARALASLLPVRSA